MMAAMAYPRALPPEPLAARLRLAGAAIVDEMRRVEGSEAA